VNHAPAALIRKKSPWYPTNRRLGRHQSWFGHSEEKNPCPSRTQSMVSPCLNVFLLYIPSCTIHALELWILSTTAYPLILIHTHLCNFVTACKSWPIC